MDDQAREFQQIQLASQAKEKELRNMMSTVEQKLSGEDEARMKMQENVDNTVLTVKTQLTTLQMQANDNKKKINEQKKLLNDKIGEMMEQSATTAAMVDTSNQKFDKYLKESQDKYGKLRDDINQDLL